MLAQTSSSSAEIPAKPQPAVPESNISDGRLKIDPAKEPTSED
jgi:hypothetical protein